MADTNALVQALMGAMGDRGAQGRNAILTAAGASVLAGIPTPQPAAADMSGTTMSPATSATPMLSAGPGGETAAQLKAGFNDAGRPDLAAMVGTPAFNSWINAESGWRPGAVSAANNQGKPNGGLFQFWRGHDWTAPYFQGNTFTMTPYQQAQAAATHFHLTPQKINGYAAQIAARSYKGWG